MNPEINRRKTSMVLHELEMALGNYVVNREITVDNIPNKLIEDIAKRELSRNRNIDVNSVRDVIEATYLDEIFQITLEITADTSSHKYLQKLKELFILFDIYEIRNVISHPNRKFIDSYWSAIPASHLLKPDSRDCPVRLLFRPSDIELNYQPGNKQVQNTG